MNNLNSIYQSYVLTENFLSDIAQKGLKSKFNNKEVTITNFLNHTVLKPKNYNISSAKGDKRVLKIMELWASTIGNDFATVEKLYKEASRAENDKDNATVIKKADAAIKASKAKQIESRFNAISSNLKEEELDPKAVKSVLDKYFDSMNEDRYNSIHECMSYIKDKEVKNKLIELFNINLQGSNMTNVEMWKTVKITISYD